MRKFLIIVIIFSGCLFFQWNSEMAALVTPTPVITPTPAPTPTPGTLPIYPVDLKIEAIAGGVAPWTSLSMIQIDCQGYTVYSELNPEDRSTCTWVKVSDFYLTVEQMNTIWDAIEVNDFFNLEENYSTSVSDGSFAVMEITANGIMHTVTTENIEIDAFDSIIITINSVTPDDSELLYNAIHPEADSDAIPQDSTTSESSETPGEYTKVTIDECNITVKIYIEIRGSKATPTLAKKIKNGIENLWNNKKPHIPCEGPIKKPGCPVKFVAEVKVQTQTPRPGYHQVRIIDETNKEWRSVATRINPDGKTKGSGKWGHDESENVYAHEAGHFMGEKDQYDKTKINRPPFEGHENDIMATTGASAEWDQDAINRIGQKGGVTCPAECCPEPTPEPTPIQTSPPTAPPDP